MWTDVRTDGHETHIIRSTLRSRTNYEKVLTGPDNRKLIIRQFMRTSMYNKNLGLICRKRIIALFSITLETHLLRYKGEKYLKGNYSDVVRD